MESFFRFRLRALLGLVAIVSLLLAAIIWHQDQINRTLRQHVDLVFDEANLEELSAFLEKNYGIPTAFSAAALPESSKDSLSFTCEFQDVELGSALRILLNQQSLDFIVEGERLVIVTKNERNKHLPRSTEATRSSEGHIDASTGEENPFSDDRIDLTEEK